MTSHVHSYHGYRFPPEIISRAVWLYHRFGLSFRDAEDLLAQRGVTVTYETIRQWCQTFGPDYARRLRRRRGRMGDTWYLDELFVTIRGGRQYLWRAVDQDGDVLDILVQLRRDRHAAARFFRKLLKPGFPFWTSRPSPLYTQNLLPGPICCCGPLGMPSKPSAGCARRSRRANRRGFLRHLPHIAPCRRPRSRDAIGRQPAGTGSAQIRWSIAPNSRRVRWLSASRSQ